MYKCDCGWRAFATGLICLVAGVVLGYTWHVASMGRAAFVETRNIWGER